MNDHSHSSGGGCFTEALAMLALIWLMFHIDPVLALLDRVLAWQP